jgi:hypothetical protein
MMKFAAVGAVGVVIVVTLMLGGCSSLDEQLAESRARLDVISANLKEKSRLDDAARAATRNCEQEDRAHSDCWDREYQRHLSDPVGASAEDSKNRQRRSNMLLAKWTQCSVAKARELAHSDLPATEAAREAFTQCDQERQEWVRGEGSTIRYAAEYAISSAEQTNYPQILGYIQDLRSGRRR